uniref:Similar to n=1 Tax=Panagrellus redivivus TaxID=6233 RepID=A0A7E4WAM3_PANRE
MATTEKSPHLYWFSSALQSLNLDESAPTSSQSSALRAPPVAPPPLPPRGGTEQQQAQRKSLTQRWLESKSGPAQGNPADASSDDSDADSTLDRRHNEPTYGTTGAYSKPYGDDEIIESDSGHRRSIDLTGIQEETEEDMAHETPTVRLLSRRTIEDDGGVVSRSDFLKGNPPYDSSESDEDDYAQHHQMSYRMGFYDRGGILRNNATYDELWLPSP